MTRRVKIAVLLAASFTLLGITIPAVGLWWMLRPAPPKPSLQVTLD